VARTSPDLPFQIYAALAGGAISSVGFLLFDGSAVAFFFAVGVGVIGFLPYDFWYSRFTRPPNQALQLGKRLPDLELNLETAVGRPKLEVYTAIVSYLKNRDFTCWVSPPPHSIARLLAR